MFLTVFFLQVEKMKEKTKSNYISNIAGILIPLMFIISCQTNIDMMKNLDTTIENHFIAIQNRDIDNLLKTVNKENVTLILPNGKYSKSLAEYKKINTDWFNDKNWNIKYEIVDKIIKSESATVLTKITYTDKEENGEIYSFQYYLTLMFELQNNEWKLVFDQNTIIK